MGSRRMLGGWSGLKRCCANCEMRWTEMGWNEGTKVGGQA